MMVYIWNHVRIPPYYSISFLADFKNKFLKRIEIWEWIDFFVSYLHVLTEEVDSLSASSLSSLSKHVIMKTAQTTFNR